MTEDARFEEGAEAPLRLRAYDSGDLQVISALVQDAVFPATEVAWRRAERCFALLLNRFRWEDVTAAERRQGGYERVRSVLVAEDVIAVRSQGIDPADKAAVFSLLSVEWEAAEDGCGALILNLAGDGVIRIEVEALSVMLRDVTRPYLAPSSKVPSHE